MCDSELPPPSPGPDTQCGCDTLARVSRRALQGRSGEARPLPVQGQALGGVAGPSLGPSLRRRSGDDFLLSLVRVEGTSVLGVLPF